MVIVDAYTHNAYYAYTTLYEHWIANIGLQEILVTDKGTEFINNEKITLCIYTTLNTNHEHLKPHGLMV